MKKGVLCAKRPS